MNETFSGPLPRPELVYGSVVGGAILGIIILGLNYTFILWKECKIRRARLKGIDIQRKKKRETDSIYGDDEGFEVFCTLVPNMVTVAAFALCVHALANKLTGRSVGSPAWYAVLAAAVATGTATWAIAAIYVYLYGRDLVNWAKRSGAKQQRRSEVSADSERQWLLGPEQKGYQ